MWKNLLYFYTYYLRNMSYTIIYVFLYISDRQSGKKTKRLFPYFISFIIFFYRVFFSESVKNFILNIISHPMFELDQNDRFFISEIRSSKNS